MNKTKRWDAILERLPENKKIVGAVIGISHGKTSKRLLKARSLLTLIMVDPWKPQKENESYVKTGDIHAVKPLQEHETAYQKTLKVVRFAGKRARIRRMKSERAVKKYGDKSLDFVFVDGDHSYEGCKQDIELWLPKVKKGGWIGGHDYKHSKAALHGVDKAVEEKFSIKKIEIDVNHTWFVRL